MSERERTWTLFGFCIAWTLYIVYENSRTATRRDKELSIIRDKTSKAESRAEGAEEATKRRTELEGRRLAVITAIAAIAGVVVVVIAYHLI